MADQRTISVYRSSVQDYIDASVSDTEALSAFLARFQTQVKILDLGCGPGHHAAQMLAAGHDVLAMDATPEFVEQAMALGVNARLARFEDLSEQDEFDAVWASFSLLHAPRSAFPGHLSAIARALKPGGVLALAMKLGRGEHRDALGRFYCYYSEEDLGDLLASAGFAVIEAVRGESKGLAGTIDPYIRITARS